MKKHPTTIEKQLKNNPTTINKLLKNHSEQIVDLTLPSTKLPKKPKTISGIYIPKENHNPFPKSSPLM